ncbi:MAG TPA: HEAT repeat domain-containing protein [Gemmatimonadales bacterium]|jgi:HEAT repeat protein
MFRLHFAIPFLAAGALSAQVPATPVRPPTPAPAPRANVARPVPRAVDTWAPDVSYSVDSYINDYSSYYLDNALENNLNLNLDYNVTTAMDNARLALNASQASLAGLGSWNGYASGGPVAWAHDDPADSLYRDARDQLNRGDYRRAAALFKSLPQKFPNSAYVGDAQYWEAFSLYRIGATPDLQEALAVLEARKTTTPESASDDQQRARQAAGSRQTPAPVARGARTVATASTNVTVGSYSYSSPLAYSYSRGSRVQDDAAALAARIASVLSTRGLANDVSVKRALSAGGNTCDQEDQSVRAEALNALMQNDPETGRQMAGKILANRDVCSVPLRRNAVMLVANGHDDAAVATLVPVARSDPSPAVRMVAIEYLARAQSDAAVTAVIDLAQTDTSADVKRIAVRALSQSSNPRARAEVRSIVESNSADESLRISAIDGFDRDQITAEDATWLRGLYTRTTNARVKERIISAVARAGGDANNQWLLALVRNEDEPLDSRSAALSVAGRTLDLSTLDRIYDAASERPIRETVIELLSERKEPEAVDKLVDIARNGTDPSMRSRAISVLARSKDPRANKALLQLVDHQ